MDEQKAIQRLMHGDVGGLEILVSLYWVKAVRTAYLITHNPALAEDVMQEALLQIYRSIGTSTKLVRSVPGLCVALSMRR